jgi:hypothetical protein
LLEGREIERKKRFIEGKRWLKTDGQRKEAMIFISMKVKGMLVFLDNTPNTFVPGWISYEDVLLCRLGHVVTRRSKLHSN